MIAAYWEIGRAISEEELQGESRAEYGQLMCGVRPAHVRSTASSRAEYGQQIVARLSERLSAEFGRGFDRSNLSNMRNFFKLFPIRDAARHELTLDGENPPIGIVLCADKSEAIVRYTLPEGQTQIFASRYKLHLPTEAELAAELQRERRTLELEQRLAQEAPGEQ